MAVYHVLKHRESVEEKHKEKESSSKRNDLNYAVSCLSLSSDGMYLAVASCTHDVYVYELDRSRLYWMPPTSKRAGSIASLSFRHGDTSSISCCCIARAGSACITCRTWPSTTGPSRLRRRISPTRGTAAVDPYKASALTLVRPLACSCMGRAPAFTSILPQKCPRSLRLSFLLCSTARRIATRRARMGQKRESAKTAGTVALLQTSAASPPTVAIHLGCVDGQLVSSLILLSFCHPFGSIRPCFFIVNRTQVNPIQYRMEG